MKNFKFFKENKPEKNIFELIDELSNTPLNRYYLVTFPFENESLFVNSIILPTMEHRFGYGSPHVNCSDFIVEFKREYFEVSNNIIRNLYQNGDDINEYVVSVLSPLGNTIEKIHIMGRVREVRYPDLDSEFFNSPVTIVFSVNNFYNEPLI